MFICLESIYRLFSPVFQVYERVSLHTFTTIVSNRHSSKWLDLELSPGDKDYIPNLEHYLGNRWTFTLADLEQEP